MTTRAKLVQSGSSQAVLLPESFRFPDGATEVAVRREGSRIILEPLDEWSPEFLSVLGAWDEGDIARPPSDPSPPRDPIE